MLEPFPAHPRPTKEAPAALLTPSVQSAEGAKKDTSPKGAGVKYQMFQPDGTPVRSKGKKGGGQNSMVFEDSSGTTKSVGPRKLKAKQGSQRGSNDVIKEEKMRRVLPALQ